MPDAATTALISSVLVPVLIGINQAIKQALGDGNSHFVPLISLALGILAGVGMFVQGMIPLVFVAVVVGAAIGLSAVGLYSGSASLVQATQTKSITPTPPTGPGSPAA